ncbi:PqqD family protein [Kroppenstedtia pulmonis]|uniref:PqqD family protein n=1 Tax=Kroppenstedtia pulmonis TaxID=1380685 RepID=A0A7D3XZP1_9BACL|nr:PqqD family protein [Kroppenstedtia pulmonis]QKG83760.1 PqqD family protein [Kroppenstedtia pulmonis]
MWKKRSSSQENVLTMRPLLKDAYRLVEGELLVPRTGWLERFSIRFMKQPDTIRVRLDDLGCFVVSRCDGKTTVSEIADELEGFFGEKAQPVLPRLVQYMRILEANGWIDMTADRK